MARNLARLQQGFFPFPPDAIKAVAERFTIAPKDANRTFAMLDAGAGEGEALLTFREHLLERCPDATMPLYGIEADQTRTAKAAALFKQTGGYCLWGKIEECHPTTPPSLLWFNPPYDKLRGEGRLEYELFKQVVDWLSPGRGLLVMIVPDYVVKEWEMARTIDRYFEDVAVWCNGESDEYGRAVLIGRRRERAKARYEVSYDDQPWCKGDLPTHPPDRTWELQPSIVKNVVRHVMPPEVMAYHVQASHIRGVLLRDAAKFSHHAERPPGALRTGHVALLVAGGLSDGLVEVNGKEAVLRGCLDRRMRTVSQEAIMDDNGKPKGSRKVEQTNYNMLIRALRPDGNIEEYSSEETNADEPAIR